MNANDEYRRVYEDTGVAIASQAAAAARRAAQAEMEERAAKQRKALRLKKSLVFQDLPAEWTQALYEEMMTKHDIRRLDAVADEARHLREQILDNLAPMVEVTPDPSAMYLLLTEDTATYSSQTQPHFYAKGYLQTFEIMLHKETAFETFVRWCRRGKKEYTYHKEYGQYELWANCPPWMFDAIGRRQTIADFLRACNQLTLNARVFMPFLSPGINQYDSKYRN